MSSLLEQRHHTMPIPGDAPSSGNQDEGRHPVTFHSHTPLDRTFAPPARTLIIDVIESETGALLYRARVTDEVGDDLEKRVPKVIAKAFKKFPVKERSG
jgi:hypothetical protein